MHKRDLSVQFIGDEVEDEQSESSWRMKRIKTHEDFGTRFIFSVESLDLSRYSNGFG